MTERSHVHTVYANVVVQRQPIARIWNLMCYVSCLTKQSHIYEENRMKQTIAQRSCCEKSKSARCPNLERRETSRRYKVNSWKSSSTQYTVEIHGERTTRQDHVNCALALCVSRSPATDSHSNGKYINQANKLRLELQTNWKEMNCSARFSRRRTRFAVPSICRTFCIRTAQHNQAKSYQLCVHLEPICKHSFWWKLKRKIRPTCPNNLNHSVMKFIHTNGRPTPLYTRNNFLTANKCQIMFIFGLISGIPSQELASKNEQINKRNVYLIACNVLIYGFASIPVIRSWCDYLFLYLFVPSYYGIIWDLANNFSREMLHRKYR